MALNLQNTLADLVRLPSVNPMGRPVSGDEYYEHRVTDYLERLFTRLGLEWQRQHVAPQRDNILARFNGSRRPEDGGAVILFEAHQDTVPVEGMIIPPFDPQVRDGRMYGRGSCDIKGGMVAMLGALARLVDERPADCPTVIMACTVNEEYGFTGATELTRAWLEPGQSIIPRRPDVAVVAEPTSLDVVVAHKGAVRWRIHTQGRAAHSSQPHLGDNAVYKMAKVLGALEAFARDVAPTMPSHPLCGGVTLSVGLIHGGISVNTVPDACTIEVDRRLLPGEQTDEVYQQVIEYVRHYPGIDFPVEHDEPFTRGRSLPDSHNGALAERLSSLVRERSGRGAKIGVPYGTDASTIAAAGVPSVVFGPGSIDQAHTVDEWLPLDELERASALLYEFVCRGL